MTRSTSRIAFALVALASLAFPRAGAIPGESELAAREPSWFSEQVRTASISAGYEGVPLPQGATVPSSAAAFPGIRPGIWLLSPAWCTLNFVFNSSGALGTGPYYIGSAKHCVQRQRPITEGGGWDAADNPIGKHAIAVISHSLGAPPRVVDIGVVSHVTDGEHSIGNDYALIQIHPSMQSLISPSITLIGGPTPGPAPRNSDPALMFGHGMGLGAAGTGRSGVVSATRASTANAFGSIFAASPGDSGAPARTANGVAIGNLTHIAPGVEGQSPVTVYGTRLDLVTHRWGLIVVTCPSARPWQSVGCPE